MKKGSRLPFDIQNIFKQSHLRKQELENPIFHQYIGWTLSHAEQTRHHTRTVLYFGAEGFRRTLNRLLVELEAGMELEV